MDGSVRILVTIQTTLFRLLCIVEVKVKVKVNLSCLTKPQAMKAYGRADRSSHS